MTLQTRRLHTLEQVRALVEGSEAVDYEHQDQGSAHAFVRERLGRLRYEALGKRDKGVVRRFLAKTAGFSEVRIDRLIRQWRETGRIKDRRGGGHPAAGGGRRGVWPDVGGSHPRTAAPTARGVRQGSFRAAGGPLAQPRLQPSGVEDPCHQAHGVDKDARSDGRHRATQGAGPAGAGGGGGGGGVPGHPARQGFHGRS